MSEHEITEADVADAVARAFGRTPAGSVELFRQAGFCDEDAARGAKLLESGRYFGFEDVASSMGLLEGADFRRRNPRATDARIAEVAQQIKVGTSLSESDGDSKSVSESGATAGGE